MAGIRRHLLAFVLGAIAVTAALGLYAVIVPHFGDLQAKVLGTSASVAAASILVLACLPAWERRRLWPVPAIGAACCVAAFTLIVLGMWAKIEGEGFWKTMGTLLIAGLFGVLASLLALARLAPRYRSALGAAVGSALVLALLGIAAMWSEPSSEAYGRVTGAVAVLTAAFVVAVPVLHRASRGELAAARAEAAPAVAFCPSCGHALSARPDEDAACRECGARFRVRFLPLDQK